MKDNTDFKQNFDVLLNYKNLYNSYKLEILASEIKQKKHAKYNLKNNVVNNFLF